MKKPSSDRRLRASLVLLATTGLIAMGSPSLAQPVGGPLAALRDAEQALTQLIKQTEPSVVAITRVAPRQAAIGRQLFRQGDQDFFQGLRSSPVDPSQQPPSGAGVVIDSSGLILTQYLVVTPGESHFVTNVDGKQFPAELKAADPRSGLAVLAVTGADAKDLPALPIGHAEELSKGSSVVAIGNPQALVSDGQPTACHGTITNMARKADDQVNLNNARDELHGNYRTSLHHFGALIQSDARLGWNASGGALVNLDGELVGITTTVSVIAGHEQPAGYAIPLNDAFRRIVATLKQGKEVEYGLLGISFNVSAKSTTTDGQPGITVQNAFPGGPAGRAGLTTRDIITAVDGHRTPNADRLQLVVGRQPPGTPVEVAFERNGEPLTTTVELSKHFTLGQKVITTPAPRWRGIRVDYPTAVPQATLEQASRQGLIDPLGCVVVAGVTPESLSWKQGVREGMFISHAAGQRVSTPPEFWDAVKDAEEAGEVVKLRFTQAGGEP